MNKNNLDTKKIILYAVLFSVVFLLWGQQWFAQQKKKSASSQTVVEASHTPEGASLSESNVPVVGETTHSLQDASLQKRYPSIIPPSRLIEVDTDTLKVTIDRLGGRIVSVKLKKYPVSLDKKQIPTPLLSFDPDHFYVAESGLAGQAGSRWSDGKALYTASQARYVLTGNTPLTLDLTWRSNEGLLVTNQWVFNPNSYLIHLHYKLKNEGAAAWKGHFYAQIRHRKPEKSSSGFMRFNTYTGAAYYTPNKPYTKLSYKKMDQDNLNQEIKGGWVAVQTHYFLSAWIPNRNNNNHYYSHVDQGGTLYTVGFLGPSVELPSGHGYDMGTQFYVGPEKVDYLEPLASGLKLTVDYGWLWPISMLIMWGMRHIYLLIGNWGWAIILITLLIKLLFFKLSESSYRSMAKMRKLQPRLERLKQTHGDDKQALGKATMALYKQEKVNPMGGCLPFIIQIPVFIALYYVLIESVELRQAPFMFWIHDLSIKDPYFILPILMGASMLLQQQMNPQPADPMQARVMYCLPIVFTILFLNFPSGLVLYWLINNCLSMLQQWYINFRIEKSNA